MHKFIQASHFFAASVLVLYNDMIYYPFPWLYFLDNGKISGFTLIETKDISSKLLQNHSKDYVENEESLNRQSET